MRFYIIYNSTGETIGCERTRKECYQYADEHGYPRDEIELDPVDVDINAETVRRLLGNLGGYANQ